MAYQSKYAITINMELTLPGENPNVSPGRIIKKFKLKKNGVNITNINIAKVSTRVIPYGGHDKLLKTLAVKSLLPDKCTVNGTECIIEYKRSNDWVGSNSHKFTIGVIVDGDKKWIGNVYRSSDWTGLYVNFVGVPSSSRVQVALADPNAKNKVLELINDYMASRVF